MQGKKKKLFRIQKRPHAAARAHSKSRWSRPSVQGETPPHVRFRGTSERSRVFLEAACCSLEEAEAAPVSWALRREQAQLAGRASHVLSREGSASIRQGRLCILTLLDPAPALLSPGGREAGEVTPQELGTSWGFWAGGNHGCRGMAKPALSPSCRGGSSVLSFTGYLCKYVLLRSTQKHGQSAGMNFSSRLGSYAQAFISPLLPKHQPDVALNETR